MRRTKKITEKAAAPTFEELVSDGIASEEQGERYVNNKKGHNFYIKAMTSYKSALLFKTDSNTLYNLGRVCYILAEFKSPLPSTSDAHKLLMEAMNHFEKVIQLKEGAQIDVFFNLAQVLNSLAQFYNENPTITPLHTLQKLFLESNSLFESVFLLQYEQTQLQLNTTNITDENIIINPELSHLSSSNDGDNSDEEMDILESDPITHETLAETLFEHITLYTNAMTWTLDEQQIQILFNEAQSILNRAKPFASDILVEWDLQQCTLLNAFTETLFNLLQDASTGNEIIIARIAEINVFSLSILTRLSESPTEHIMCELGDLYTFIAEFNLYLNNQSHTSIQSLLDASLNSYKLATQAYLHASSFNPFNKSLLATIGDMYLLRIRFSTSELYSAELGHQAVVYYERAFSEIVKPINQPTREEIISITRLAKAYSWAGKVLECGAWKIKSKDMMKRMYGSDDMRDSIDVEYKS